MPGWLNTLYTMGSFNGPLCPGINGLINSLWPNDATWQQSSVELTLAQVMACCLTAPSHYLNQCWLIISEVVWHSPGVIPHEMLEISIHDMSLKINHFRSQPHLPGTNELMAISLADPLVLETQVQVSPRWAEKQWRLGIKLTHIYKPLRCWNWNIVE